MGAFDNPKVVAGELAITNHPLTLEERPFLVEVVRELHDATTPAEFSALHTKLLTRYLARQRIRAELRADRSRIGSAIGTLARQAPKPEGELGVQQELLRRTNLLINVQGALAAHTRAVTDGLVWKALRYDRAAITILGRGTRVDHLAVATRTSRPTRSAAVHAVCLWSGTTGVRTSTILLRPGVPSGDARWADRDVRLLHRRGEGECRGQPTSVREVLGDGRDAGRSRSPPVSDVRGPQVDGPTRAGLPVLRVCEVRAH